VCQSSHCFLGQSSFTNRGQAIVDFRGSYDAGFPDLLAALAHHLGPLRRSREIIDTLLAKAVRARLHGDIRSAIALVEQLVGHESDLAATVYSFGRKLETALDTNLADTFGPQLTIRETTRRIGEDEYPSRLGYDWALELHGSDQALDAIDAVVYTLHETFPIPSKRSAREQIISGCEELVGGLSRFGFTSSLWI
jgi:hypothetical protein